MKLYIEDLQDISALMNHLYSFDTKKKPSFEKPAPRFDRTVRNGFQKVSQDTNRILNDTKPYGNILDFRGQQEAVNDAIALFSGKSSKEENFE